jgi:hypothetical protein
MPILKRRLDICGREKTWEFLVDSGGSRERVTVRQVGQQEPLFACTCCEDQEEDDCRGTLFEGSFLTPCAHVCEVQRELSIARQAAAQMIY